MRIAVLTFLFSCVAGCATSRPTDSARAMSCVADVLAAAAAPDADATSVAQQMPVQDRSEPRDFDLLRQIAGQVRRPDGGFAFRMREERITTTPLVDRHRVHVAFDPPGSAALLFELRLTGGTCAVIRFAPNATN